LVPEGDTVVVTPDVAVTEAVEVLSLAAEEKLETELFVTLVIVPLVVGGPV
jgi:K+ transporter